MTARAQSARRSGSHSASRAAALVHAYLEEGGVVPGAPPRTFGDVIRTCLVDAHGYAPDAVAVAAPTITQALIHRLRREAETRRAYGEAPTLRLEDVVPASSAGPQLGIAAVRPHLPTLTPTAAAGGIAVGAPRAAEERLVPQLLRMLRGLSPTAFEVAMRRVLTALGCHDVQHVGGSGDGGVDLVAAVRLHVPAGARHLWQAADAQAVAVYCQAKRYRPTNPVGPAAIREFLAAMTLRAGDAGGTAIPMRGLLVTSGVVTSGARRLAHRHQIVTVPGVSAARLLAHAAAREGVIGPEETLTRWLADPSVLEPR